MVIFMYFVVKIVANAIVRTQSGTSTYHNYAAFHSSQLMVPDQGHNSVINGMKGPGKMMTGSITHSLLPFCWIVNGLHLII